MTRAPDAAGEAAVDLVQRIAEPIRTLRDRLGLVVDHLERHVATASGPAPYPWRSLQTLRQDLATVYLDATALARRVDELDRALADQTPGPFDLSAAVELGLRLAGHQLGSDLELVIDLGHVPPVHGSTGTLALLVAQLVGACAASARARPGSALSVRTWVEDRGLPAGLGAAEGRRGSIEGREAVILVADNGEGSERAAALGALAHGLVADWGATVEAASAPGQGSAFELRFPVR